jgi:hypothetical protein
MLRRADPAQDDPGLDPHQQAAIRRAMQQAADQRDATPRPVGLWAVAALAIVSLAAVALVAVGRPSLSPHGRPTREVVATTPAPPVIASLSDIDIDTGNVGVERSPRPVPAGKTDARSTTSPRTILFTTHNGTQIIWKLDPRFALPAPASDTRGEKS